MVMSSSKDSTTSQRFFTVISHTEKPVASKGSTSISQRSPAMAALRLISSVT